jgi:hypothetical protein
VIEYLERIGAGFQHDVWLVRVNGELGQAQVFHDGDDDWQRKIHDATRPWLGFVHPHVVPVISAELTGARLVIVHGDERGPSITKVAPLIREPAERAVWAIDAVASVAEAIALMAWREPGFVHRRANREQIVVGTDGVARLRALIAFVSWGTLGSYTGRGNSFTESVTSMAPEQILGAAVSAATDVHALAGTLYTALTLRHPFARDTEMASLMAIRNGEVPAAPVDVAPAIGELITHGLAIDPARRPVDPATFAAELRRLAPEPVPDELRARIALLRPPARPAPAQSQAIMGSRCMKRWDELTSTASDGVRHCAECQHDVVQVRSIAAVIPLLGKRCIAFTPDAD